MNIRNSNLYLKIILLAGLVTSLMNLNILAFNEEFLIAIVSCVFFGILVIVSRHLIRAILFKEIDTIFLVFMFLLNTIKQTLETAKFLLKWILLCSLNQKNWFKSVFEYFSSKITKLYINLYKITITQLIIFNNLRFKAISQNNKNVTKNIIIRALLENKKNK